MLFEDSCESVGCVLGLVNLESGCMCCRSISKQRGAFWKGGGPSHPVPFYTDDFHGLLAAVRAAAPPLSGQSEGGGGRGEPCYPTLLALCP